MDWLKSNPPAPPPRRPGLLRCKKTLSRARGRNLLHPRDGNGLDPASPPRWLADVCRSSCFVDARATVKVALGTSSVKASHHNNRQEYRG